MKLAIFLILFFSTATYASCSQMTLVAKNFTDAYIQHLKAPQLWSDSWPKNWVQANQYLTSDFKLSYKTIMQKAFDNDSDFGLGFDPILDAQDYPAKGYSVLSCDNVNHSVLLQGKQLTSFTVKAKLKKMRGQWLINQMGVVNNKSYIQQMNKLDKSTTKKL